MRARTAVMLLVVFTGMAGGSSAGGGSVPRFSHVFLIVGENTSFAQITPKHAPYLVGTLERHGVALSNYHSFTRSSSLGQYIALVSGQYTHCEADNALPAHCHQDLPTLLEQLAGSARSWQVWQESMPKPCYPIDAGRPRLHNEYTAHHNPAIYFTNIAATCRADDLPMGAQAPKATSAFDAALARGQVGNFNMIVPNDCENGHDACGGDGVRHFDNFLAREVPRIQSSPAFGRDGLGIVTWDEGGDPPQEPGHVLTVLFGPLVRPGLVDRNRFDHYALERTLAQGFGVPPLAHAAGAPAITNIWR